MGNHWYGEALRKMAHILSIIKANAQQKLILSAMQ
jgi:hypothetical protein